MKNFNIKEQHVPPFKCLILIEKAGVKRMPSTKIDFNHNRITRIQGLDELAGILFPGNKNHQRVFLAVFIELKYASGRFLPSLLHLCDTYGFSSRMLETVRSKMRRMGIIDHVSRFNKAYGYREGWILSHRFFRALTRLGKLTQDLTDRRDGLQEQKDRDLFRYL